jgi:hypothetical protein
MIGITAVTSTKSYFDVVVVDGAGYSLADNRHISYRQWRFVSVIDPCMGQYSPSSG